MDIYLLNCTPEPAELLIADVSIWVYVDYFVHFMHFFLTIRISIVWTGIIDPKSSESEIERAIGKDVKQLMATVLIVGLIELSYQRKWILGQLIKEFD